MEEFLNTYDIFFIWGIGLLMFLILGIPYYLNKRKLEKHTAIQDEKALRYGLNEPVSLYPKVDPNICIGSAGCIAACPEQDVLGLRNGQGVAVNKAYCVGHGLCERSCPVDAITLVFGSATRGVEIPRIQENFETNVKGIYIVGELGGMGLIRNAFEQGRQCVEYVIHDLKSSRNGEKQKDLPENIRDLTIIGCGPAGLSATIHSKMKKLNFVTLEREDIGGTVRYYPRKKLVLTNPLKIPQIGTIHKNEIRKEELIDLWGEIVEKLKLKPDIQTNTNVSQISNLNGYFEITTSTGTYLSKKVILAIGRRGTPRKLNIPGENLENVAYNLLEPEHYINEKITVVGGGDSAIEAAIALSEQPGNTVRLSYRKNTFSRLKPKNNEKLREAVDNNTITLQLNSNVVENTLNSVTLSDNDKKLETLENDSLFIFAGGILPTAFLREIGIKIDHKFGEP